MVGIVIDDDLVAVPEPIIAVGKVKGANAEVEAAKPEPVGASSGDAPDVAAAEAAGEPTMFPGMIEVEAGIVSSGVVSDPRSVVVDVRSFGMAFFAATGRRSGGRAANGSGAVLRNKSATDSVAASAVAAVLRDRGQGDDEGDRNQGQERDENSGEQSHRQP